MAAYLIGEVDMITCKEDLLRTYVVNDGEIRSLYVGLCNKFGIECESNSNASGAVDVTNADYIEVYAGICFYTNTPSKESSRELTIDDLKEKTKPTKFVKVEGSIFDLKEEFEGGELYFFRFGKYEKCNTWKGLCHILIEGNAYRQVEIDWRDEVKSKYSLTDFRNLDNEGCINLGDWTPEGFIKLCHFVAELTDKPE